VTPADAGYGLRTWVRATNSAGSTTVWAVRTAPVAATPVAPSTGVPPALTGTATQGQTLAATTGTWSGTSPMTYAYQWQRCDSAGANCAAVPTATGASYLLGSSDVGKRMRVAVTASNAGGQATATSSATAVVLAMAVAPSSTALPVISGTATQGQTLIASSGSWSGTTPMSFAYQWQRCDSAGLSCAVVAGATGASYPLGSGDVGKRMRVAVTASNTAGATAAVSAPSAAVSGGTSSGSGKSIVLTDKSWRCTTAVSLDLVKVTMKSATDHAVYLLPGCTGYIGRIEVDTWHQDGVKVGNASDVVIGGGYIACHDRDDGVHQDGVQAQSGLRITFRALTIDCPRSNNAAFFVSAVSGTPTDVVCESCTLKPANSTVNIKTSVRSGVRNSIVCRGTTAGMRIQDGAVDPINENNSEVSASDSRCVSTS
jgi:hypothetical protein